MTKEKCCHFMPILAAHSTGIPVPESVISQFELELWGLNPCPRGHEFY